jgi:cytoskeletal protein CcmA (bactofilin family)
MSKRPNSSFINSDVQMLGDLSFSGDLHLSGKVTGNILAPSDSNASLYLQADSQVDGEIRVPNIVILGEVIGNIFAENNLEIANNAKITGDVHYIRLKIASGADINGKLTHVSSTP